MVAQNLTQHRIFKKEQCTWNNLVGYTNAALGFQVLRGSSPLELGKFSFPRE